MLLSLSLSLSLRLNGHFPFFRCIWVSWYQNVSILDFIAAQHDGGGGDNWSYKTCKAFSEIITTNKPTPSFFYRPDVLPISQTTVSEHCLPCYCCLLKLLTLMKEHCKLQQSPWCSSILHQAKLTVKCALPL